MKNLLEILKLSTEFLQKKGLHNPRRQAEELIADVLKLKRLELYLQYDRPLTEKELDLCRTSLNRRAKGEPIQYIRGEVEFLNCHIKVNSAVIIPRQETEILADKIIKQLSEYDLEHKSFWDVCCGPGSIGIAIKKKFPKLNVVLSDISKEALSVARENAALNNVEIEFFHGDLLQPFKGRKTDFFVCNPPYISDEEYKNLEKEVRDFEPKLALVSGTSGLEFYQRLANELPSFLQPNAKVWFEIGTGQGPSVKKLFSNSIWSKCDFEKDWAGHDRFFFLEIE